EEKINRTAIVLADESLLLPVLYSLPVNVPQANVTMGRSLRGFSSALFFESFLKFHSKPSGSYYFKDVVGLLHHPLMQLLLHAPEDIVEKIAHENRTYLSPDYLATIGEPANKNMLDRLFRNYEEDGKDLLGVCLELLRTLLELSKSDRVERLVWARLQEVFREIQRLANNYTYLTKVSAVYRLYNSLVGSVSLDFEGDAYTGLQIMGVLETRGLDFENIIMLSVNEGILPAGKSTASFMTYDLKTQFELPSYTEKDAIYTYHFYRLLQRAKEITLVYNSHSKGLTSGEKSRFLLQLEIEQLPKHTVISQQLVPATTIPVTHPKEVHKTQSVLDRIKEIAGKYLSPSALTSYVRNPMEFYYQRILKLSEFQDVEEIVDYSTLGTIVHDTLETLYKPFEGERLESTVLKKLSEKIAPEVIQQFEHHYKKGAYSKGKNLIIFEVAKRYVANLIRLDINNIEAGHTIKILNLEQELVAPITIPGIEFPVNLGGKVDRVDLFNDTIRIIDYKTGKVHPNELEIVDWPDLIRDYKYSKAFQVLSYAYIMSSNQQWEQVQAGIISFKNLSAGFMPFAKKEQKGRSRKDTAIDQPILEEFKQQLSSLITEICDSNIPFVEKEVSL
ncbi:MAG: PD-(D/E)XK nuclease family protein, partial [Bacteroidota bacterium]